METIISTAFLVGMIFLSSRIFAAYLRVRDEGVEYSQELLRADVTLEALRAGDVRNRDTAALLPVREGLVGTASRKDGIMVSRKVGLSIRRTRTVARDIY